MSCAEEAVDVDRVSQENGEVQENMAQIWCKRKRAIY
jgi:hypothetical protein